MPARDGLWQKAAVNERLCTYFYQTRVENYQGVHSSSAVLEKAVRVVPTCAHIKIPDIKKNDVDVAVLWLKVKPLSITETGTPFNSQPCINTGKQAFR